MPCKKMFVLVLALISTFLCVATPLSTYAANTCSMTADPAQVPKGYGKSNTSPYELINVNIDSGSQSICSFKSSTVYRVVSSNYKNINRFDPFVSSSTQLSFNPDGNNMPDKTKITFYVCDTTGKVGDAIESWCKPNNDHYVGQFIVQVGGDKAENPDNLPTLDPTNQTSCAFQTKSDVTLKVTGLIAGKKYQWWEDGTDWSGDVTVPDGATETDFTIAGVQGDKGPFDTPDTGDGKTVCVDIKEDGYKRAATPKNCIVLKFGETTPSDTSCGAPVVTQVDPPCAAQIGAEGCSVINTAIGQIKTSPDTFLTSVFGVFLSISGGIALLMIIRSGYQLMTSQGNAEKVKEAQDRITSAVVGLLFALFSLVILESIGVDILHIPGLGH